MHVLDVQRGWCREAAECGARILAIEERNARAAAVAVAAARAFASAPMSTSSARALARCSRRALAHDPGLEAPTGDVGCARRAVARGRPSPGSRLSNWMQATLGLARPLGRDRGAGRQRIIPKSRAASAPRSPFRACRGLQRRRRGRGRGFADASRSWSINRASTSSACTIPPGSQDYPDPKPALEHAERVVARARARRGTPRRRGRSARRNQQ